MISDQVASTAGMVLSKHKRILYDEWRSAVNSEPRRLSHESPEKAIHAVIEILKLWKTDTETGAVQVGRRLRRASQRVGIDAEQVNPVRSIEDKVVNIDQLVHELIAAQNDRTGKLEFSVFERLQKVIVEMNAAANHGQHPFI